jgi:ApaG protein
MKASIRSFALAVVLSNAALLPNVGAFTPTRWPNTATNNVFTAAPWSSPRTDVSLYASDSNKKSFLGMDNEDSDEEDSDEEDEDDDDDDVGLSRYSSSTAAAAKSPFTGLKLDPFDPKPLIKPRPSRVFQNEQELAPPVPDEQLTQKLSTAERQENLTVMRQIRKSDLPDLRRRKDHAGWVEANNDLKRRLARDPWFAVNERLRDAIQLGEAQEQIDQLQKLATKLGGPPPGIETGTKGYAVHTEIYDIGLSPTRAASMMDREIRAERAARGRAMMVERQKNLDQQQRQYEEDMRNPGVREDKEAKERRERTMRRLMDEIEEDNKKKRERAKEILGKVPDTPKSRTKAMEKALKEARDEVKKMRRQQLGQAEGTGSDITEDDDEDDDDDDGLPAGPKSGADKAREAAAAEASGGRPRLPGDDDVTRGELDAKIKVESSSTTVTDNLEVQVTSVYNKEQSDPPMRKHCFQYTIRITNNSPTDTIQLLGRRFEIQTVGSSMKDVVQGEGVTGRTPVLKPGEVFEYTSTAPLSVRPIGTTEIAARMRGEYRYVTLDAEQETATEEQLKTGGDAKAELGMFHFVFPEDQRVKPFRAAEDDDDEEEEEDDEDDTVAATAVTDTDKSKAPAATPSTASTPASTLPGDEDMKTGDITVKLNDSSEAVTDQVRVQVTSSYRPERSDEALDKHCFAYNIRITNEAKQAVQLVSRRFEIQTIGSVNKDVVQGPGVTGRQPILKPGESFEYTSTAPLSVKPFLGKTPVVARMQGEYNFVQLADDGTTPISSTPLQAQLGMFHFILPALT